jgi:hypothetical protein
LDSISGVAITTTANTMAMAWLRSLQQPWPDKTMPPWNSFLSLRV